VTLADREARRTQASVRRSHDRIARQAPALRGRPLAKRLARFRRVVNSASPLPDKLQQLRELLPGETGRAQQVLVWGHACALEVNSAGLPILFDRFSAAELRRIDRALEAIGARATRRAFERLRERFRRGTLTDAAEKRATRQSPAQVREIESRLLDYCQANLEGLVLTK
jgi:hypothetical protein